MRKAYSLLRKRLPLSQKAALTKLVYWLSGKPFVKSDGPERGMRFPAGESGGLILSADFEMAWAFRFVKQEANPYEFALRKARQERANFPALINLFKDYNIPVTWATVGHLFLESCSKDAHAWMERMPYFSNCWWEFRTGDWFDHDPASDYRKAPEWYAPDLIRDILQSGVGHELATHTFSHVDFSDRNCPEAVANDEMRASMEAMCAFGVPRPIAITFPSGSWGNVRVLKKFAMEIYRRKINGLQLAYPFLDEHGLLATLSSDAFDRSYPTWSSREYRARYLKAIAKAVKTGTVAHFVFHPSMDPWMIAEVMPGVLEHAAVMRKQGRLWIGTMGAMARHIRGTFPMSSAKKSSSQQKCE